MSYLDDVRAQAVVLAKSRFNIEKYSEDDLVVLGLYGRRWGWDVAQSVDNLVVLHNKISLKAETMLGLVRAAGHWVEVSETETSATVSGKRADSGSTGEVTFTKADAERALLWGRSTWAKYPRAMLRSRAVSEFCRSFAPDVLAGVSYTPEEVESIAESETTEDEDSETEPQPTNPSNARPKRVREPTVKRAELKRDLMLACNGDKDLAAKLYPRVGELDDEVSPGVAETWRNKLTAVIDEYFASLTPAEQEKFAPF